MGEEVKMEVEDEQVPRPKLELEIMATVQAARETNGLRHFDYQRYRTYCTRRLRRMRKNRNIRFMYGKGKQFVKHPLTEEEATDPRHLMILLVNAERAWGYAMEIEDKINNRMNNNEEFPQRWYLHLNRRLAKASKWSVELRDMCAKVADERTELEAGAYSSMIQGWELDNKGQFQAALAQYNLSKSVFEQMHKIGSPSQKEVFASVLEKIAVRVQYCEYSLQNEQGIAPEGGAGMNLLADEMLRGKLERVMAQTRKDHASESTTVHWKGRDVMVRSEKLRITLLQAADHARELEGALSSLDQRRRNTSVDTQGGVGEQVTVEDLFSRVLSEYDGALREIQSEEQRVNKQKAGAKQSHLIDELKDIKEYVRMQYCRKQIDRYFVLAADLESKLEEVASTDVQSDLGSSGRKRPRTSAESTKTRAPKAVELIRMFDKILAAYDEIETMFVEVDSAEAKNVLAECAAIATLSKGYRSFHAGRSYSERSQWPEATSLYNYALETTNNALDLINKLHDPQVRDKNSTRASGLITSVKGARCVALAKSFLKRFEEDVQLEAGVKGLDLKKSSAGESSANIRFLLQRLEDPETSCEEERMAIYPIPPIPVAIASRPTLLDRAFRSIDMPDLDSRAGKKQKRGTSTQVVADSDSNDTNSAPPSPSAAGGQQQKGGWLGSASKWFSR